MLLSKGTRRQETERAERDGVRRYLGIPQSDTRTSMVRNNNHPALNRQVFARARVVAEKSARIRDARRRRLLDTTVLAWRSALAEEKRMAVRIQSLARGRRDR